MATPGQLQMYNKLEVSEMFSLDHRARDKRTGQIHRIHIYPDEKVPHAVVFVIWLEDHTLGNLLRMELLRNADVLFVGYKVPHPLDNMIELRLQTLAKSTPEEALRRAIANLRSECRNMLDQFDAGVAAVQQSGKAPPIDEGPDRMRPEGWRSRDESATPEADTHSCSGTGAFSPLLGEDHRFQEQLLQMGRQAAEGDASSPTFSPTGQMPLSSEMGRHTSGGEGGGSPVPTQTSTRGITTRSVTSAHPAAHVAFPANAAADDDDMLQDDDAMQDDSDDDLGEDEDDLE